MSANAWRRIRFGIGFAVFVIALAAEAMAQPVNMIWQRDGRTAHSAYGTDVFGLGDQNQDGYTDFAVLAAGDSWQGGLDSGVVELFHGGNPPDTVPYHVYTPASDSAVNFFFVSTLGDLNGDGFTDYGIAYDQGGTPTHHVVWDIYFGGPLDDFVPDLRLHYPISEYPIFQDGGDFNGDGYDDIFVVRYTGDPEPLEVLYGGAAMDTITDWVVHHPPHGNQLTLPRGYGDLNGDGFLDFVTGNSDVGDDSARFWFGGAHPDTFPAQVMPLLAYGPIYIVNDLNGDHDDDVVRFGGHTCQMGGMNLCVHFGQYPMRQEADYGLNIPCSLSGSMNIGGIGDFNGDGYGDFVQWEDYCTNNYWGMASVYLGYDWINPNPVFTIEGRMPPYNLIGIRAAAGLGDVNGDGVDDLGLGAWNNDTDGQRGRAIIIAGSRDFHVSADPQRPELPRDLRVSVYPNPFNSETRISFSLPKASRVKVEVFDVTGRLGRVLTDEIQTAGEHSFVFDGMGMASGIYFVRVEAGGVVKVQKMVMVK